MITLYDVIFIHLFLVNIKESVYAFILPATTLVLK